MESPPPYFHSTIEELLPLKHFNITYSVRIPPASQTL